VEIPTSAETQFVILEIKNTPHRLDYLLSPDWRAVVVVTP
jgi:hypothetical protein